MKAIASLESKILYDRFGKRLWMLRTQPWHAAFYLTGTILPPHERFWLGVYFGETKENNVVASRGTSKSFTHASMAAPLKSLLFKNITTLTLSASGFRGGKELFLDAERMHLGQLKSQRLPGNYLHASTNSAKVLQKDPSIWTISYRSHSRYSTVPTNNPDQLRGLRANEVLVDERNTFPGEIVGKIIRPMLNVGQDFRRAAKGGERNKMYQVSTIDFTVRDWYPEIAVAASLQRREYLAHHARKEGDWEEYERQMNEKEGQLKTASYSYTRIDYTDLLIPEYFSTLDGEHRYRVEYPLEAGVERSDILAYDEQDRMAYWYTYPVDRKGLEQPMRDGTVDEDIFLAENRNCFIASSGNVFDFELIQKIAERPVWTAKEQPRSKRRKQSDDEDDVTLEEYYAPILYSCGDPCVLACDVARESDETSFTVIRLGELAEGVFDPFVLRQDEQGRPLLGNTDWNHICWAESHRKMQAHMAADKLRDLKLRFNIIHVTGSIMTPGIPGIAIDKRGGGSAVRDELGNPKPNVLDDGTADPTWKFSDIPKLYDPDDIEGFGHYSALNNVVEYWGGLRLLATTNQDNLDWTYATRGMMQQKKLYIGFWTPPSRWAYEKGLLHSGGEPDKLHPDFIKWEIGYTGIRRLKTQLLRLQTKVSEQGLIKFVMPGDRTKEEGKKDLWASTIYAVALAREHLLARTRVDTEAPMVMPLAVEIRPLFGDGLVHRSRLTEEYNW